MTTKKKKHGGQSSTCQLCHKYSVKSDNSVLHQYNLLHDTMGIHLVLIQRSCCPAQEPYHEKYQAQDAHPHEHIVAQRIQSTQEMNQDSDVRIAISSPNEVYLQSSLTTELQLKYKRNISNRDRRSFSLSPRP